MVIADQWLSRCSGEEEVIAQRHQKASCSAGNVVYIVHNCDYMTAYLC
jgi:hypothetical protein